MNDDELPDGEELPASCYPTKAKDMFGVGREIIRDLLENGCFDDLYETWGIRPAEAALSLHCAEIASWPWWDLEAMVEAATVYQSSRLKSYKGSEGCEAEIATILDSIARIKRRIYLAAKEPDFPDALPAAEAVMFLERIDLHVFHELRDAVASRLAGQEVMTQEDWNRLRRLLGKEVEGVEREYLSEAEGSGTDSSPGTRIKLREQERVIIDWLKANDLDPQNLPYVQNGYPGARSKARAALDERAPFEATTAFGKAWQRLRDGGEIKEQTKKR